MDSILGQFSSQEFLSEYWQKKPVLIRQAFPAFESPLSGDELAGLSLEDNVLSRLVLEQGGDYPWQLKSGPLKDADFDGLGEEHWTILVQEVDKHVPAVADLFDRFDFLPSWRRDDVMVSFAADKAGVGAHIDSYDVFLLQGSGRRRWEIGEALEGFIPSDGGLRAAGSNRNDTDELYIEGLDVRILKDFKATQSFDLEPGDMLYLPPGVPHNGVALEPCLTFSFGFLAPSRSELLMDFADWEQSRKGVSRYSDQGLDLPVASARISSSDLERIHQLLGLDVPIDEDFAEWFGLFITRPQRAPADTEEFEGSVEEFMGDFEQSGLWRRHEGVRLTSWLGKTHQLFCDGEKVEHELESDDIDFFLASRDISWEEFQSRPNVKALMHRFLCRGWAYLVSEDE